MNMLNQLEQQGFMVRLADGEALNIWPANQLTDATRQWIRQHRAALISELSQVEKTKVAWLRKGLTKEHTSHLLDILQTRDAQLDDRRSCVECLHFYLIQKERMRCRAGLSPIGHSTIYALHRCTGFIEG